jgi:hypothetical protein
MPMELAVPLPVEGVGLLFTATELFSNVQAVMVVALQTDARATVPMAAASAALPRERESIFHSLPNNE